MAVERFPQTPSEKGIKGYMSMESYDQNRYDSMVYDLLREAELQAVSTTERCTHEEVMAKARALLNNAEEWNRTKDRLS